MEAASPLSVRASSPAARLSSPNDLTGNVPWYVHAAFVLIGMAGGVVIPAGISLWVLCVNDAGLSKKSTAAPLGVITACAPFVAQGIGPLLSTALLDVWGVRTTAIIAAVITLISQLASFGAHCKFVRKEMPRDDDDSE